MAPNVQLSWERIAQKYSRFVKDFDEDEELLSNQVKSPPLEEVDLEARRLWETILSKKSCRRDDDDVENYFWNKTSSPDPTLIEAFSSIIVLDDASKNQDWLESYNASLSDVSPELLKGLRQVQTSLSITNRNVLVHSRYFFTSFRSSVNMLLNGFLLVWPTSTTTFTIRCNKREV
jgi:hypothetical protein